MEYRVTQKQLRALEDICRFIKQAESTLDIETAFLKYIVDSIQEQPIPVFARELKYLAEDIENQETMTDERI